MATKVRSYSKGPRKLIANQPAVHLQLCGDSIAIQWNPIQRKRGGMEGVTFSQPAAHSNTNFTFQICYSIRFYGKSKV